MSEIEGDKFRFMKKFFKGLLWLVKIFFGVLALLYPLALVVELVFNPVSVWGLLCCVIAFIGIAVGMVLRFSKKRHKVGVWLMRGMLVLTTVCFMVIDFDPEGTYRCFDDGVCRGSIINKEKCAEYGAYWQDDVCYLSWSPMHPDNKD